MKQAREFLTAEWKNLVMLNYAVDPALLRPFVPRGVELDFCGDKTYLSLVGFEFNRTRLLGRAVPFHQSFEEVNLRFYVRRESKRGVVFIKELVPKRAVATIARLAYNENYSCVPMSHRLDALNDGGEIAAEYAWDRGANRCVMRIETEGEAFLPVDGSLNQFIAEHYWGYAAQPGGGCLEYEVQHPPWPILSARNASFSGEAAHQYGAKFAQVLAGKPDSAVFAEGSPVTVFKPSKIVG